MDSPESRRNANIEALARETRVDGAHSNAFKALVAGAGGGLAHSNVASARADAIADEEDPLVADFLQGTGEQPGAWAADPTLVRHATELAERLRNRLADVDRREARLNAQEAEFDSRVRSARLWISQQEEELEHREGDWNARNEELRRQEESAAALLASTADLDHRLESVVERERLVERQKLELEIGLTEQQTRIDALDFETAACRTRQSELDAARQACEKRQRELDAREGELYADHERLTAERLQFDKELRVAAERESALAARETALREWESRLREEASAAEFQRNEFDRNAAAQDELAADLAAEQRRLKLRHQEIETALRRFERLGIVEERINELDRHADELDMRSAYLDNAEALLAEQQMDLSQQRRALEEQQLAFENRVVRDRQAITTETSAARNAAQQREQTLDRRDQALDRREAALDELAEQLRSTQRETLELRLATEETWLQLQGALAPATLARSIAHLRGKLAEQYQLAADQIDAKRSDLEKLRLELAEQFSQIEERQLRLQHWAEGQQRDIEQQAARLVQRERELDDQHRQCQQMEGRWDEQRAEYQREIQRLLGTVRKQAA